MDKVINGVDVSGCEFSCENTLNEIKHSCNVRGYEKDNGLHIHLQCKNNPDCYYKQLQRAKAENERQKEQCDTLNRIAYENIEKYAKIKFVLQDIRDMATLFHSVNENKDLDRFKNNILDKINEVIGAE